MAASVRLVSSIETAEEFVHALTGKTDRQRARLLARMPLDAIQAAALQHPEPQTRYWMLCFLDHFANDGSMQTFAAALHDSDEQVRLAALHSIACESCKQDALCVADVVPDLITVLHEDPSVDLRMRSLAQLTYLAPRDDRIKAAIAQAAKKDPDPILRKAAADALAGRFSLPRKRYERSQRRHAGTRATR